MSKLLLFMVLMSSFAVMSIAERSDCPVFSAVTEVWRGIELGQDYNGDYGCYNGYCWAECDALPAFNEWCYTTQTYSQSFQYVQCSSDDDCCRYWACAGSCTV